MRSRQLVVEIGAFALVVIAGVSLLNLSAGTKASPSPASTRTAAPTATTATAIPTIGPATPSPAPSPSPTSIAQLASIDAAGPIQSGSATTGTWVIRNGRLMLTLDGGSTWANAALPSTPAEDLFRPAFAAVDAGHAWLVQPGAGSGGVIVNRTSDGGATWQSTSVGTDLGYANGTVLFADASHGILLLTGEKTGGTIAYRTADGGKTWTGPGRPNSVDADIAIADASTLWASSQGAMAMCGNRCSEPLLQVSRDGGNSWTDVGLPGISAVADANTGVPAPPTFFDSKTGLVAVNQATEDGTGTHRFFRTNDGGRTWAAAGGVEPGWLERVAFVDAKHWRALAGESHLLATDDAGASWRAVELKAAADFYSWWWQDPTHAFAIGLAPIGPEDQERRAGTPPSAVALSVTAFQVLYATADAGATWTIATFGQ